MSGKKAKALRFALTLGKMAAPMLTEMVAGGGIRLPTQRQITRARKLTGQTAKKIAATRPCETPVALDQSELLTRMETAVDRYVADHRKMMASGIFTDGK